MFSEVRCSVRLKCDLRVNQKSSEKYTAALKCFLLLILVVVVVVVVVVDLV